jgi:hypothetical protein
VRGAARGIACVLTLALAAACSSEPTSPDTGTTEPPDLARNAFLLTIDVPTGRVTVGRPQQASQSSAGGALRPSLSLLGSDAISLHAGNCTFSSIPNNSKLKSCSMSLSIENQLAATDLLRGPTAVVRLGPEHNPGIGAPVVEPLAPPADFPYPIVPRALLLAVRAAERHELERGPR